ncbi:MAG: Tex family protein [Prevotella sp.]|nr:Tex family protein [Prevotella sp.]
MNIYADIIAARLALPQHKVANTLALLQEGCTIPFISRYRKEKTGGLDEVQIAGISEWNEKLTELSKRKETICKTINELGKMTDALQQRIDQCWESNELEDIYLPYKPKRRTKAQMAREMGLEPLATLLLTQREQHLKEAAKRFIKGEVTSVEMAIKGAQDIIAETISENEQSRQQVRNAFQREAVITSKVVASKKESEEAAKFTDYFDFSEPLRRCSGNRFLAIQRGEKEGILRVKISIDSDNVVERLKRHYVKTNSECGKLVAEAVEDAYKRLIEPSIENELTAATKEKADEEAIHVFTDNLRQLLLSAPLGQKRVMAIDPGIRTGCKVVCLDSQGNLLHHDVVYPFPPKGNKEGAQQRWKQLAERYNIEAIAIGNGTAGRETNELVQNITFAQGKVAVFMVSEDGASIYSASKTAREEFPDEDVTVRGAVSIGRRLMDPLAELVKIDPKSIGVGQYQHDVDQTKLKKSLDVTVSSCVNSVGVNINTASKHLLTYISGLGPTLANNIVEYRKENGAFTSRSQLKKVPRLGPSAFVQCAGFMRIPDAKNPLDNSAVHPESYPIVEKMAKDAGCKVQELINNSERLRQIDLKQYVTNDIGLPTLTDIIQELEKPGLDPRAEIEEFSFDKNVHSIDDLHVGMVLPGIVTNITKFGAFVDIGVHQDGLVHISQLANKFVSDAGEVVKLHQHVQVKVIEIDNRRNRISLSMKEV